MCNEKLKQMRPNESLNNTSSGVIDSKTEILKKKIVSLEKELNKAKVCFF